MAYSASDENTSVAPPVLKVLSYVSDKMTSLRPDQYLRTISSRITKSFVVFIFEVDGGRGKQLNYLIDTHFVRESRKILAWGKIFVRLQ